MLGYDYFLAINNGTGFQSPTDIEIYDQKRTLKSGLVGSVNYDRNAEVNGKKQGVIIIASENYYKAKIEALPGEMIYPGDIIYSRGEHWIVRNTRLVSPFQVTGMAWMCNMKFRWQNGTPRIIERWGVLDSGVYSSTRDGDATAMTADKQYKVYLPYDRDSEKLNIDKRLAVGFLYSKELRRVLNVQQITGYDPVSTSYGRNGHILVLNVRSGDYIETRDSVEHMICDYIEQDPFEPKPEFKGEITGADTIRLGKTKSYTADFIVEEWSVSPDDNIEYIVNESVITITACDNEDLVGEDITITATTSSGDVATKVIGVIF